MAMMFPAGKLCYVILEPGNVRRMKGLLPLKLQWPQGTEIIAMVVTPDIEEFEKRIKPLMPCGPDVLERILRECQDLKEVDR